MRTEEELQEIQHWVEKMVGVLDVRDVESLRVVAQNREGLFALQRDDGSGLLEAHGITYAEYRFAERRSTGTVLGPQTETWKGHPLAYAQAEFPRADMAGSAFENSQHGRVRDKEIRLLRRGQAEAFRMKCMIQSLLARVFGNELRQRTKPSRPRHRHYSAFGQIRPLRPFSRDGTQSANAQIMLQAADLNRP